MKKQETRNLTINRKKRLMQQKFPNLEISRSTVYKIVIFLLKVFQNLSKNIF